MIYTIFYSRTTTQLFTVEFDGTKSELEALVRALMDGHIKEPDKFPVELLNEEVRSVMEPEFKITKDGDGECPVIVKNNTVYGIL